MCGSRTTAQLHWKGNWAPEWDAVPRTNLGRRIHIGSKTGCWWYQRIYLYQKEMYESGTHRCEDRIVSLQQPHVRPIVRGKRPGPTGFGQNLHLSVANGYTFIDQPCWNIFNKGNDLPAVIENCFRRCGYCLIAILADKLYQTRSKRNTLIRPGIRAKKLSSKRRERSTDVPGRLWLEYDLREKWNGKAQIWIELDYVQVRWDFQDKKLDCPFLWWMLGTEYT